MLLRPQFESSIGVDMTSSIVRLIKLTKKKHEITADQVLTDETPSLSFETKKQAMARLLESLKSATSIKNTHLQLSIDSREAQIRYTLLPALDEKELHSAIQLQVEAEKTISRNSLNIESFIAEKNLAGARVALLMISNEKLKDLIEFCGSLDCPLDSVEVEPISYFNSCRWAGQLGEGRAALLDLRKERTALHVFGQFSPSYSRVFPTPGAKKIVPGTDSLAVPEATVLALPGTDSLAVPKEEAKEATSPATGETPETGGVPQQGSSQAVIPTTSSQAVIPTLPSPRSARCSRLSLPSLAREVHETLQYLECELRGSPVQKLIVTGDGLVSEKMITELSQMLAMPVEPLHLPAFLHENGSGQIDPRLFGVAFGAAYGVLQE